MTKKKFILRESLIALSAVVLLSSNTANAKAAEQKPTEQEYRNEHQIDEDINLLDLSSYRFQFIKVENDNESKYYFCVANDIYTEVEEKVSSESVESLFKNTPSENYMNSDSSKYLQKPIIITTVYTDIFDSNNKFYIHTTLIDVFDKAPSNRDAQLICWGDIKTFSSTISDEVYTEYYSFDVPTQQTTIQYNVKPQFKISCEYVSFVLGELYPENYITEDDLEDLLSVLNGEIPRLIKEKNEK